MKRQYAPFGVLAVIACLFALCLVLSGFQSVQRQQQQDKNGQAIAANNTVTYSPADAGVKAAAIATATTLTGNNINLANAHTILVAINCNQAISTLGLVPIFEDGTSGTTVPIATTMTASQWDYVWLSDTMTESAIGGTAGNARLPVGVPNAQLSINNTSGSTATCNARVIVQY